MFINIKKNHFSFPNKPHTIFIDEVQDLQPAILFLFTLITKEQIIFCGDTAQTIAKGMDFRFSDLKKLFYFGREMSFSQKFPMLQKELQFKTLNVIQNILKY